MADSEVPLLDAADVPSRAAAVRELAMSGAPDIIPQLVELARSDASPAIRLATAAAAADILSRYRVGDRATELSLEDRRKLLAQFNAIDPAVNSGLFSMLASLGLPEAFGRISIGLRDPRGGVRVGAAVGLLRLTCSVAAHGDEDLESKVVALLHDKRLKPDALAEVAEVCAAVGYVSAIPSLEMLASSSSQGEVVGGSLRRLQIFHETQPLGAFRSDGRDAGEVNESSPLGPATVVAGPSLSLRLEGSKRAWGEALAAPAVRRLYIRPVGAAEPVEVIQWEGRTWYKAPDAELEDVGLEALDFTALDLAKAKKGGVQLNGRRLRELFYETVSVESAKGRLLRGAIALACGDVDTAKEEFQAGAELKKIPVELHYFLGEYPSTKKAAKEHLEAYQSKTKGKGPFSPRAEKLLKKK